MSAPDGVAARWGAGRTVTLWALAYLYGSAPLVYWLGRRAQVDLRQTGSGNVGATNLLQHGGGAGRALAALGWVFDASKGALPPVVGRALGAPPEVAALAGALGTAGQCWPAPLAFRGGRGVSAFVGAAALTDPLAWALSLIPMIVGSLWHMLGRSAPADAPVGEPQRTSRSRSVPLGCFFAATIFPLACLGHSAWERRRTAPDDVGERRAASSIPSIPSISSSALALSAIILLRRLTAPLPDDALAGPGRRPAALLYRLLYDRNTRD